MQFDCPALHPVDAVLADIRIARAIGRIGHGAVQSYRLQSVALQHCGQVLEAVGVQPGRMQQDNIGDIPVEKRLRGAPVPIDHHFGMLEIFRLDARLHRGVAVRNGVIVRFGKFPVVGVHGDRGDAIAVMRQPIVDRGLGRQRRASLQIGVAEIAFGLVVLR